VREDRLVDIWERADALRFTRDDDERMRGLWGQCGTCYYADDCLGGCSWTAHALFGRRGNNPFCHHRALELLRHGRRERLVRIEAPPGVPFDHGRFELVEEDWPALDLARAREVAAGKASWLLD